jgi:hypothetical protein
MTQETTQAEAPRSRPRSRRAALLAIWLLPSAVLLGLAAWVQGHYRIDVPPGLGPEARAEIVAVLRAALRGEPEPAAEPGQRLSQLLSQPLAHRGPVLVSVLEGGRIQARVMGHGSTLAVAVREAAGRLAEHPGVGRMSADQLAAARLKIDVVVGRGPVPESEIARALGVHPGLEGLGVTLTTAEGETFEELLAPDEVFLFRLLGGYKPLPYVPELRLGLDFERADMSLATMANLPAGGYGSARRSHFRLRTDSFVEPPAGPGRDNQPPLALTRGLPPPPPLTAESLRAGAIAGGRYLVDHIAPSGRYIYERDLTTGKGTDPSRPGAYSIPRHAGSTYFLAELYRLTGESFLREPIERAFAHLQELIDAGGCAGALPDGTRFACVVDRGQASAHLGSTALTVVALAEYQRATGDARYEPLARALAAWILYMQRPDGSFAHLYDVKGAARDEHTQLFFYAGESALALARMHAITGEARYRDAAERAIDALIAWYDFFLGSFFYGEEHWTCIAAEAIHPAVKKDAYRRFCNGYAEFLRAQQPRPGAHPDQADWAGSYNFTPFLVPQNTPAGSRTESMISAYLLGAYSGQPEPAIRDQIEAAMRYALGQQIRAENDFHVAAGITGIGAVPGNPIDRQVRIDFVQHVCSAMIRYAVLLAEEAAGAPKP